MSRPESLSVELLARRCTEEMHRFRRHEPNDPAFCFELFRRALQDGSLEALTRMYEVYEPLVLSWVVRHSRFEQSHESADFFAHQALSAFYFALRGQKFGQFAGLPKVLAYLKLCVHTAIAQYVRDHGKDATIPLEDVGEVGDAPQLGAAVEAAELWAYICRLLPDERDRLLARCVFVLELKPRQIVRVYPEHWNVEREVSVALYRIRRVLRNDAELRRLCGTLDDSRDQGPAPAPEDGGPVAPGQPG